MQPRHVLITGASRGIGRAAMRRLAQQGYRVTGVARSRPDDLGENEYFHSVDLTDLDALRALVQRLGEEYPFYAVVNNAAMSPTTFIDDVTLQDMHDAMRLNVDASLICVQAALPGMRSLGTGRIVNLSSRAALGKVNRTAYAASKAAIVGMTRTWALELARDNITVNVIAPGPIATELFRTASPPDHPNTKTLMAAVPLQRVGEPEEIAHAIEFLLDPLAGFMTGQTLHIDGGLTVSAVKL